MSMDIRSIIKTVPVKNRVVDGQVRITFDSQEVVWEPGEVKHLPEAYADWFQGKSLYQLDNVFYKHKYRLAVLGKGQDESDLSVAQLPNRADSIIDWNNRRYIDQKTQKEYRRVEVPVNGVPVMEPRVDRADLEVQEKMSALEGKKEAAVEKLASFSEAEVAAGLAELSTTDSGTRATVRSR